MAKWEEAPEIKDAVAELPKWSAAPEVEEEAEVERDPLKVAQAAGEALATVGTGAIAQPVAGLAGLASYLVPGAKPGEVVKRVQQALTYEPNSPHAKRALGYLAYPFEKLAEGTEYLGGVAGGELGAVLGRVGGEALPMVVPGGKAASGVRSAAPEMAALRARAAKARAEGYKVPPTMAGDTGFIGNIAEGIGGKIKTSQQASIANQEVTNRLVKKDLGVPEDAMLTPELLSSLREKAGRGYAAIKDLRGRFKSTDEYIDSVYAIGQDAIKLGEQFPGVASVHKDIRKLITSLAKKDMTPRDAINLTRQLRFEAKSNYKNFQDPGKLDLAKAQERAAELVENLIDSNLQAIGKPELLDNFRAARTQIAKVHGVEKVFNETTGNVPARKLGSMLDRGEPLSGGMKTAAEFSRSFEKAAQSPEMIGGVSHVSPLDYLSSAGLGVAGGLTMGPYGSVAAMVPGFRPLLRAGVLSKAYQQGSPILRGPLSAVGEATPFAISGLEKEKPQR